MVTEIEKKIIEEISEKYKAKRVLLFGSSLFSERENNDIDIVVEGIEPKDFFAYYGDLMFALSKPIDIIDLSEASKFVEIIQKEGILLYG